MPLNKYSFYLNIITDLIPFFCLTFAGNLYILNKGFLNWLIFIILSIIWGSSFIMMKEGLLHLTAYQVAALRIVSAGIVLLPWALRSLREVPKNKILIIFMSGVMGSLLPAFLFCVAEEGIDSALAGTLNSLTPIFVIIVGAMFFKSKTSANKVFGIIIAFTGSILLLLSKGHMQESQNLLYISFIVLATIFYGINVNMVHKHLHDIGSLQIAAVALTLNAVPALVVLYFTCEIKHDQGRNSIECKCNSCYLQRTDIVQVLVHHIYIDTIKNGGQHYKRNIQQVLAFLHMALTQE